MKIPKVWLNLSILNLCTTALLGLLLRSKQLFEMSFIDYNHLVTAHGHFGFDAWAAPALLCLFVYSLLPANPGDSKSKYVYNWLLGSIIIFSWAELISIDLQGFGPVTNVIESIYILVGYVFAGILIKDILKARLNRSVRILATCALCLLILASLGTMSLAILFYLNLSLVNF